VAFTFASGGRAVVAAATAAAAMPETTTADSADAAGDELKLLLPADQRPICYHRPSINRSKPGHSVAIRADAVGRMSPSSVECAGARVGISSVTWSITRLKRNGGR